MERVTPVDLRASSHEAKLRVFPEVRETSAGVIFPAGMARRKDRRRDGVCLRASPVRQREQKTKTKTQTMKAHKRQPNEH